MQVMDIDQQHQIRYDRQIRLWGDEGQKTIQQARICMFGSTALASEILKSLVLAGIGSFHIIDDAIVEPGDLGQNFFLETDFIGRYRGECLAKLLMELNPSVQGQYSSVPFREFSSHDMQMLLQFSLVIAANMGVKDAVRLDQFLFGNNIPLVYAHVFGMLGHMRLSFREHFIWNDHSENDAHDLRIDIPFPELSKLASETDLDLMTHEQHSHTPYVLLYFKAIDAWRDQRRTNQDGGKPGGNSEEKDPPFPDIKNFRIRKEIEKILLGIRQPDAKGLLEEENFAEATRNLLKGLCRTKVPGNVSHVFSDPKAKISFANIIGHKINSEADIFWILCAALNEFIDKNGQMPLSGQLPDMTSDSKRYTQLLNIYRDKSMEDAKQFYSIVGRICEKYIIAPVTTTQAPGSLFFPSTTIQNYNSASETDESATETDEELSRMSTSEANDEHRTSISIESMEGGESSVGFGAVLGFESANLGTAQSSSDKPGKIVFDAPENEPRTTISFEQCKTFCKNASKIGVQYGTSLWAEFNGSVKPVLERIEAPHLDKLPPQIDPLIWYVLLRVVDRFNEANGRIPKNEQDLRDFKRCLTELLAETMDVELIRRQDELFPLETIQEMCRFGAAELHVVSAVLGGCAAQEAIKLFTHQYVPVNNSLIFDGHSQNAVTFRAISK